MTPQVSHERMVELLPWYVNGTLEAAERATVETHLAECADCREELAFLQDLGAAAEAEIARTPVMPDRLGETLARIDAREAAGAVRRSRGIGAWLQALAGAGAPVRWALAAQLALILVLGGLLLFRAPAPEFRTLSGSTGDGTGTRLTVMFDPSATEAAMREVLATVQGAIVAGPSASGVYVVQVPVSSDDDAAVDAAIEALRGEASVVRFAEREP